MGSSGSGKSTLMNILGCLDTPTAGKYYLDGEDVSNLNDNQLAEIRNNVKAHLILFSIVFKFFLLCGEY
jgi:ABC-type lipoprotein export system ATPase subunit